MDEESQEPKNEIQKKTNILRDQIKINLSWSPVCSKKVPLMDRHPTFPSEYI